MAYSLDLRERVVAATQTGLSVPAAARLFQVSTATIERWRRRTREGRDLGAHTSPGRRRWLAPEQTALLDAQIAAAPDASLLEHCRRWAARTGVVVSTATMSRWTRRLGWTVKKSPSGHVSRIRSSGRPGGWR
jgi:transposase